MKDLILLLVLFVSTFSQAQQSTPKTAWLEKWENSKTYLLEIAENMPEEFYDFKPTERQMTFKEQLIHIKNNMDWLSKSYFTSEEYKRNANALPNTKTETMAALKIAFEDAAKIIESTPDDALIETVDFFAGNKSKLQILNLLQDHVTHHRGQLIVYLNLNFIELPKYSGW